MNEQLKQTPHRFWRHECPFLSAEIDEHESRILQCRCFEGPRFLAAQDAVAVRMDSERGAAE